MTNAPSNLISVRNLLIAHLNVDKDTVRSADLEPAEVGIVGDSAHRGGYHCGRDRVVTNDYSVVESPRDRDGLTLDAAALDVGQFDVRVAGKAHNLYSFSVWCVSQCKANTPDTQDIREIIYSPDGRVVRRWDRLGRRSSGDSSHIYHTHFSFFRDAIKAGRDQTPLFRRYLTTIGLLGPGGNDMFSQRGDKGEHVQALQYRLQLLGFYTGALDGDYGPATQEALKKARASVGSSQDGSVYDAHAAVQVDLIWARKWGQENEATIKASIKALEDRLLALPSQPSQPQPTSPALSLPANVRIVGNVTIESAE